MDNECMMPDGEKRQLLKEVINSFAARRCDLGEVVEFAVVLIVNAWMISSKRHDDIEKICDYVNQSLRASLEYELEQMIMARAARRN